MTAVSLDDINRADKPAFLAVLGDVFEHAPWVAEVVYSQRPFASLAALLDAMTRIVRAAPQHVQLELIRLHPDLAGKAARVGDLTADSQAEQTSAGLDRLTDEEYDAFHRLNTAYQARFGFPFIICVRRHTRWSILREFERRTAADQAGEVDTAVAEIFRIVALRLDQRVDAPVRLPVHGRLSTHVLDTRAGRPAAGVAVSLWEHVSATQSRCLVRAVTNADGRTDQPLMHGRPLPIGHYELRFEIGAYFADEASGLADPPFLDVVPLRFAIAEPEGHYHVPLVATPWSYATYRGS